jgi:chromate transport protein ChrA
MAEKSAGTVAEIFAAFLKLGLTSFGGPIAHLGYFRTEFVERRKWLSESSFADIVALCQFLPGPASSQVGFTLGILAGWRRGSLSPCRRQSFSSPSRSVRQSSPARSPKACSTA